MKSGNSQVKMWPTEYHHRAYIFDYKVTADMGKITDQQWLSDEAKYHGTSDADNDFLTAFYNHSLNYKGITFDGNYTLKTKRIVRDMRRGGTDSYGRCSLQLYLRNMEKYMSEIITMPDQIKGLFSRDYCHDCNETCKYRFDWKYENTTYRGCGGYCFEIVEISPLPFASKHQGGFDEALIPYYWRLLELEYGLQTTK